MGDIQKRLDNVRHMFEERLTVEDRKELKGIK